MDQACLGTLEPLPESQEIELKVEEIVVVKKSRVSTDYEYMNSLIKRVKDDWDPQATEELLEMFNPLIQYIEERLYQYFGWSGTKDDIRSHFLELVHEYDRNFKNDTQNEKYKGKVAPKTFYFPYYIKSKLWFRVSEYLKSFNEPVMNTVRCKICDGRMISINQSHLKSKKCREKQKVKNISISTIEVYESLYGKYTHSEKPGRSVNTHLSYSHQWDFNFKAQEILKTIRKDLSDKHADMFVGYYLLNLTQKEMAEIYKEKRINVSNSLKEVKLCLASNN